MTTVPFCKFHGFGNDYIVVERDAISSTISLPDLARAICHRHTGAGSDGIAVVAKPPDATADFFCEIVNPDGSIAGFSGNGTRCAVAYLYHNRAWAAPELRLATRSGIKSYKLLDRPTERSYVFEAEIGKPKFGAAEIPVAGDRSDFVIDREITVGVRRFLFSGVNVGNPVACIFVDNFDFDWRRHGRVMETHAVFPERANIVFVKVVDDKNIELRIWERGAGETSASGTCSSGAAVLSAFKGETGRDVRVHSPGGVTGVRWRDDDEILLTGRAELVYLGEWPI